MKLNVAKCEVMTLSKGQGSVDSEDPECTVGGQTMQLYTDAGKCLGYWWQRDLLASCSVRENINKARRAFFHYGSISAFQGYLSPLSSKSVIETCMMPVLLFGCQNWILTENLIDELQRFQVDIAKRILKWPKHHSNTVAVITIGLQTVKSRILKGSLVLLQRVLELKW